MPDNKRKAKELMVEMAARKLTVVKEDELKALENTKTAIEKWIKTVKTLSNYHSHISTNDVVEVLCSCLVGKCPGE
jgi:hypothetical protein